MGGGRACQLHTLLWPSRLTSSGFSVLMLRAKSLQSGPALCDPMDYSLQAPLSMGFPKQEY